ncbi:MAG: pantoate--beta-alanine ligase [Flavobacteriales bacterium]|nr:pantoate--beta-alanine ligase [Flavobacteriales bacterium]
MEIIQHTANLEIWREKCRENGQSVGFVPTMGALHTGHLELIRRARRENDVVICSVFVNPTQFNVASDLQRYPRRPEEDMRLLRQVGCDACFLPTVEEMYPQSMDKPEIHFGKLTEVLEASFRPGHFEGVVQVVGLFFAYVQPHRAYFGEKDFQQLAIIKAFAKWKFPHIEVVPCAIVRDNHGLALSSRNELLSDEQRETALFIHDSLVKLNHLRLSHTPQEAVEHIHKAFHEHPDFDLEYFEVRHPDTFELTTDWNTPSVALVAAYLGGVRLIDNLRMLPLAVTSEI